MLTNHSFTVDEALEFLEIDMDKFAQEKGWDDWDLEELWIEW